METEPPPARVTELLIAWRRGEAAALDRLVQVVHAELRRLARRHMRGESGPHTLQTTALVHEAYMRLIDLSRVDFTDRAHFMAMASRLMRRILVDHARTRGMQKRGGGQRPVPLDDASAVVIERSVDLIALDDALEALAAVDARKAQVIELRFYGGLDVKETAATLGVSVETVARDWRMAKLWLLRELQAAPSLAG